MAIKYVVIERKNPLRPDQPSKWYAVVKSAGEIVLKLLGKKISQRCTVNHADTLAVLEGLTQLACEELAEGKIVRFGDFGSFRVSISSEGADSEGADSEGEFTVYMINGRRVIFTPGPDLKEMLRNLKFEKQ